MKVKGELLSTVTNKKSWFGIISVLLARDFCMTYLNFCSYFAEALFGNFSVIIASCGICGFLFFSGIFVLDLWFHFAETILLWFFFCHKFVLQLFFFLWFFLFVLYLLFYIVKFILTIQLYFCLKKQCENKYYKCQCKSITQTPCINHFFQFKGTLMQIWKSPYILYSYKNNTIKISHSESQGFLKYLPVKFVNFLKSRLIFNIVYCFWVFVNKLFTYLTCSYLKK